MSSTRSRNRLLAGLPEGDRLQLLHRSETVELVPGDILCEAGERYSHVYFPLGGSISTVVTLGGHRPLEISLIGSEGMLGATLVLGIDTTPLRAVVQGAGTARRIGLARFRDALRRSTALRRMLRHYLFVLLAQLSKGSVCNRFHRVDARLARWLLMTHDRSDGDSFHLTHEFLAAMLGARRSGISVAASRLRRDGLIRYSRGTIRVLDRPRLETRACGCYAADAADYAAVFAAGRPGSSAPTPVAPRRTLRR